LPADPCKARLKEVIYTIGHFNVVVPLVVIIFIIIGLVGAKKAVGESTERGNEMIRTVYVYLVLFATLMMAIGGTVAAFMAVADIVAPPAYYQSIDEFKKVGPVGTQSTLSEAETKKLYDQAVAQQKQTEKDRAVNSLIKSFGWIVIPLPVFVYFQRRMKNQQ